MYILIEVGIYIYIFFLANLNNKLSLAICTYVTFVYISKRQKHLFREEKRNDENYTSFITQ